MICCSLPKLLDLRCVFYLSCDQNPGYLLYRGDYTTQSYGDCNKPFYESLLTNQYFMECQGRVLVHVAHLIFVPFYHRVHHHQDLKLLSHMLGRCLDFFPNALANPTYFLLMMTGSHMTASCRSLWWSSQSCRNLSSHGGTPNETVKI